MKSRFKATILTMLATVSIATMAGVSQTIDQPVSAKTVKTKRAFDVNNISDPLVQYRLMSSDYDVEHAGAAAAMDATTGQVLFTQNGTTPLKVASLSKLMTLYLVIQKVQSINNGWNQVVNTSGNGLRRMGRSSVVGGFVFKPGHQYTVQQLYQAALIQSSNNATIALGRWVAGSNKKFINLMNQQARAWNLNANFVSASGLDNYDLKPYGYWAKGSYNAGNTVSAEGMMIIAKKLLDLYPAIVNDSQKAVAYTDGQRLTNENRLLKGKSFYTKSLYVDGLKTGYTPGAGLCLVATSQKPGQHRLLTVVLNDSYEFTDTRDLMKFVYANSSVYTGDSSDDRTE